MFKQSEVIEFAKSNLDRIITEMDNVAKGRFLGGMVEILAAEKMGGEFCDAAGYDYMHHIYGRVEVKSTTDIQKGGSLRVSSLRSKKGECDFIHIIDMNSDRHFLIPHDIFFSQLDLNDENELRWSASYNENDNVRTNNTRILLQFEKVI